MTDPTTILREAIADHLSYWYDLDARIARSVLAIRIPQACQTCKGSTYVVNFEEHGVRSCPDCPTIGDILLAGWNAVTA